MTSPVTKNKEKEELAKEATGTRITVESTRKSGVLAGNTNRVPRSAHV